MLFSKTGIIEKKKLTLLSKRESDILEQIKATKIVIVLSHNSLIKLP